MDSEGKHRTIIFRLEVYLYSGILIVGLLYGSSDFNYGEFVLRAMIKCYMEVIPVLFIKFSTV